MSSLNLVLNPSNTRSTSPSKSTENIHSNENNHTVAQVNKPSNDLLQNADHFTPTTSSSSKMEINSPTEFSTKSEDKKQKKKKSSSSTSNGTSNSNSIPSSKSQQQVANRRQLELEAYAAVITAFKAQGELTWKKRISIARFAGYIENIR